MARVIRPIAITGTLPASGAIAEGTVLKLGAAQTIQSLAIMASYTRGGAGGSVAFVLQTTDGTNWYDMTKSAEATPVAGAQLQDVTQRRSWLYQAEGTDAELFCFVVWIVVNDGPIANMGLRMTAKEVGNTGAPGALVARFAVET